MTLDQDVVIERVRKLIALTTSSNVNEAALAADRVQALLLKYNLDMADVAQSPQQTTIIMDTELGTDEAPWRRIIAAAVAQLFFGRHFYTTTKGPMGPVDRHVFLGTKVNTASAKMMFQYLCTAVDRLATETEHAEKTVSHQSFVTGAARTINSRIMRKVHEQRTMTNIDLDQPAGQALVVQTMHEQSQTLLDNWVTEHLGGKALVTQSQAKPRDEKAYAAGREAGKGVSLDQQVGGTRTLGPWSKERLSSPYDCQRPGCNVKVTGESNHRCEDCGIIV